MDAGNSPAQLARQAVRYLRSCVIAKITGLKADHDGEFVGSELLQISPDEQRRAARTAALFSEEELTRFLQTMLRTFDELGYRQEQRFHFEPVDPPDSAAAEAPLPPPPAAAAITYGIPALQQAIVTALAATKGQQSSSEQIEDATFTLNGDILEIQTQVSINMLPIIINAEADRILKATLRQNNAGALKVKLLPGTPSVAPAKKSNRPAAVGSAADLAAKHPIVQQAQQLFNAEISKVIDLRGKD